MNDLNQELDTALAPEVEIVGIFGWDSPALIQLKHTPFTMTVKGLDEIIALARKIILGNYTTITAEEIKLLRKAEGKPLFERDILFSSKTVDGKHRPEIIKAWAVWEEFTFWQHKTQAQKDYSEPFAHPDYLGSNAAAPENVLKAFTEGYEPKTFWFEDGVFFRLFSNMPPKMGHGKLGQYWAAENAIRRAHEDAIPLDMLKSCAEALDKDWTGDFNGRPVTCLPFMPEIFEWRALRVWLDLKIEEKSRK